MKLLFCILLTFITFSSYGKVLKVGSGQPYATLEDAASDILPGDEVVLYGGVYNGNVYLDKLQGTAGAPINIHAAEGEKVIVSGGANGWHLADASYLTIADIIFEAQTGNGFNADDGGSYATPAHHINFTRCTFRNIDATGNNDLLKMSGVDEFTITDCFFENGAAGGSGIDMVGCHTGVIERCRFEKTGSNAIQAKGGCKDIRIDKCVFIEAGQRALNLGGSTGLAYFRPADARFEASDIKVYSSIFIGSEAPVCFVGCINSEVVNNTIYLPGRFVVRILQETVDTSRFAPCGHNTFRNNLVYRDNSVSADCNVGPDTDPRSFIFSNNLWYNAANSLWTGPALPVADSNSIINEDPLFLNAPAEFGLPKHSPAAGKGYPVKEPVEDHNNRNFLPVRSIGALEGGSEAGIIPTLPENLIQVYPNPVQGNSVRIQLRETTTAPLLLQLTDLQGRSLRSYILPAGKGDSTFYLPEALPAGIYLLKVNTAQAAIRVVKLTVR